MKKFSCDKTRRQGNKTIRKPWSWNLRLKKQKSGNKNITKSVFTERKHKTRKQNNVWRSKKLATETLPDPRVPRTANLPLCVCVCEIQEPISPLPWL